MTEWGPALTGPECKQLRLPGDALVCSCGMLDTASAWGFTFEGAEYTLPANHPAYKVAEYNRNHPEAPMVYHGGSEEAPKDWNGGEVLHALGGLTTVYDWALANEHKSVIGYVPTLVEESDTVTLKRMTEAEWFEASRNSFTSWAHSVGLIREETLLEQFEREVCLGTRIGQNERNVALAVIDWMEKRQGDKS